MAAFYVLGLLMALLIGGAIGVFIMGLSNERAAEEQRANEEELADRRRHGPSSFGSGDAPDDTAES